LRGCVAKTRRFSGGTTFAQRVAEAVMKIVVGLDFSEMSERALQVAVNLARQAGGAELHLVHVVTPPVAGTELAPSFDVGEMAQAARAKLEGAIARMAEWRAISAMAHVVVGVPHREIPRVAEDAEADLIVIGTHGRRGLDRLIFGSVAEHVVRFAHCSVLTVRPKPASLADSIEPPCPECLAAAAGSGNAHARCARHTRHHPRPHTYSEIPEPFAMGSQTFRFN
jgi:nucleotide-binding universal stress UspA family protein